MAKVLFIAKTNINTDGRILNQINILQENIKNINLDFILFPDKEKTIDLGKAVKFHLIETKIRNIKFLRPFTVLSFTYKALKKIWEIKPEIIHAQDSAIVLPVLLYHMFFKKKCFLIYDDHELPNENESTFNKLFYKIERKLMKRSDVVIFANKERLEFVQKEILLRNSVDFFLNLPYTTLDISYENIPETYKNKLKDIDGFIDKGYKLIMHQGPIKKERGRKELALFVKRLPEKNKVLLLGGNKEDFLKFVDEYKLNKECFLHIGNVNYEYLSFFWLKANASIVMYLPTYINNRLCAPNRLYLSYFMKIPIIVNQDNIVLSNFIKQNNCGLMIEDYNENPELFLEKLFSINIEGENKVQLLEEEKQKLVAIYKKSNLV